MISSVQIIGAKKSGGAEKFFLRLVHALAEKGHPVHVVLPPDSESEALLDNSIDRTIVKMRNVYDFPSRWKITKLLKRLQPDIVQTWMGRATRLTHLKRNTKPVHIARLGGFYNLKGYKHAHAWIGNTLAIQGYLLENGLPADKVFHISNFVEPSDACSAQQIMDIKQSFAIPDNAICIVSIGRLHENKGFDTLIRAFQKLPLEIDGRPLHLCIVGDGPLATELQVLSASLMSHQDRIHWAGWQADPHSWYQLADLFVCPSRHEPLGNVILEAWSHNKPVISTATHGGQELIENGINGILTGIDNIEEMQQAMQAMLSLPTDKIQGIVDSAGKTLNQKFGKDVIVQQYIECYQTLLNQSE